MKLSRPIRRTPPETIIALIDVVFFLLVFFMLIGRMDATSPFEVLPATGFSGSDMPAGGLTLAIGSDGQVALGGIAVAGDDVVDRVTAELAKDPGLRIRINAHRSARLENLLPMVAELEQAGVRDVMLVITPERP